MLGRRILVGITYLDTEGRPSRKTPKAGIVTATDPLITIDVDADEPFTLPPDPEAYDHAAPGDYRLHPSGEVVTDPDFITTWTVTPPQQPDGDG